EFIAIARDRSDPETNHCPPSGQWFVRACESGRGRLVLDRTGVAHLIAQEQRLSDVTHGLARIHGGLLKPPIRFRLGEPEALDEQGLGAVHELARLTLSLQLL